MSKATKGWVLLLIFFLPLLAYSQCCSPGSPIGGAGAQGVNEAESWQIFAIHRYGYAGRYFEGSRAVENGFIQSGSYQYSGWVAAYGLTQRLTFELESGYFWHKTQRYADGILPSVQSGRGLTDLNVMFRFNLWRDLTRDIEISSGLGFKAPLNSAIQTDGGAALPRDLQPSSGAYDLVHSLFIYRGFGRVRSFVTSRFEHKSQSQDGYRFGDFFTVSAFGSYALSERWVLVQQFRAEFRARDSRPATGTGLPLPDGREQIYPTGSRKLFWVPQLSYAFSPELRLSLLLEWPLYQYYHERQLGSTFALTGSLGYTIGKNQMNSLQIP